MSGPLDPVVVGEGVNGAAEAREAVRRWLAKRAGRDARLESETT
jgi:hypothetical protein